MTILIDTIIKYGQQDVIWEYADQAYIASSRSAVVTGKLRKGRTSTFVSGFLANPVMHATYQRAFRTGFCWGR